MLACQSVRMLQIEESDPPAMSTTIPTVRPNERACMPRPLSFYWKTTKRGVHSAWCDRPTHNKARRLSGCRNKCIFWTARVKLIKNDIWNPLFESFGLVYVWVRSAEGKGVLGPPGGVRAFLGGSPRFFWATSTEFQIYRRNPELKPSRFAPFLSKLG